jgi:nucleoid-associated protein YgaU
VKLAVPLIPGLALLTILGIGCATQKEAAPSSALDIDAPPAKEPAMTRTPPVYTPPPAQVFTPPPQPAELRTADEPVASPAAAAPASGLPKLSPKAPAPAPAKSDGTYTVQKGDTLFRIAKDRYGSGAQWEKIAAANPGVNAASLKVGQKLKLP